MRLTDWVFLLLNISAIVNCQVSRWNFHETISQCGEKNCKNIDEDLKTKYVWQFDTNCRCDEKCREYGDCCYDSPYFNLTEQESRLSFYKCERIQSADISIKTKCPDGYTNSTIRNACETIALNDPLSFLPVTNIHTYVTYKNAHCALCYNDTDLKVWRMNLTFPDLSPGELSKEDIIDKLYFNKTEKSWGVDTPDFFASCEIIPVVPEDMNITYMRQCHSEAVDSCASDWTNASVRNLCKSYTHVVFEGNEKAFRNPHCAECNYVERNQLNCMRTTDKGFIDQIQPLTILFDLNGEVPGARFCRENERYNISNKKCNSIEHDISMEINNYQTATFDECTHIVYQEHEYTIYENKTIYVHVHKKMFYTGEYTVNENGDIRICTKLGHRFTELYQLMTFIGFIISIFFIILHLVIFVTVPIGRSFSCKNFSSLCIALLFTYISLLIGNSVTGSVCYAVAIITSYSLLSSFSWMLIIAYDVWRTIRLADDLIKTRHKKQQARFVIYSLCCWTIPGLITGTAIWVDLSPLMAGSSYKPYFAVHSCWFGNRTALMYFFIAPFTIIMILNLIFFLLSAYQIYMSTRNGSPLRKKVSRFALYLKLIVITGLTWATGLLATAFDEPILWYMFTILNTLQGFFICIGFTFRRHVMKQINERFSKKSLLSFSSRFKSTTTLKI